MSVGFYERLSAISADTGGEDGMTELVVAALGSFGRYYICWKTRSGEYKQESSGLPAALQRWLFPTDGRTRDFATLQVVLGRGDDFFASDRAGKVENKTPTTSPDRNPSPNPSDSPKPLDRASRRRSRTMSLVGPPAGFRLSQSLSQPIAPISEFPSSSAASSTRSSISSTRSLSSSGTRPSRPPSTYLPAPLALARQERDWKRRPRSIAFGEDDLLPEPPRKARGASPPTRNACCHCGCHGAAPPPPAARRPASRYVDAGMQTDPPPPPSGRDSVPVSPRRKRSFTSDFDDSSSVAETGSSVSRSRRSSAAATDITAPSTYGSPGGNPIVMGEMQNYFRSTGYQLGDALRPQYREPMRYVEVGLVRAWTEVLDRRRTV
ncbi:hypothetical protein GTA08_BOTSDO08753 [Neofusicoccum parvum]|nr:hypothetical protein GTA08_BOTSDO08753 [Neofusicoccum parvum]